jgi:hypothetical protein
MPKTVTKGRLIAAMELGRQQGFNHQVDEATINALDPAYHYPVLAAIPHRHKDGAVSEYHVRVLIEIKNRSGATEQILIDVTEEMYSSLPEKE